ncbi:ECF RNA polymerase sigma factor SigH [Stieleria maiorica]|uniref:ECF RNA polymerase sigma factor SigH n=1 Tax=Stieleria maiorica TaxID=2795974 RepID=A0A5B9MRP3_9BACT|nr:sigma-70 family RNA polymerase sigma factor [Stieleria maiorica]QEG02476.1 ECF RNA polymerase sigma factor SigH [Stieleria maiorica]
MSNLPADDGDPVPEIPAPELPGDSSRQPHPSNNGVGEGGNQDLWRRVFDDAETGLRRFLSGKLPQTADVDDCLQTVFVAMLKNDAAIPPPARRAWLYRVAANEAARWWRKKSTTDRVLEKHAHSTFQIDTDSTLNLETEETLQRVHQAIATLPENVQQVIRLRLGEGMTFQAIADRLDQPLGTVLTRMRRAMQQLRNELDVDDST